MFEMLLDHEQCTLYNERFLQYLIMPYICVNLTLSEQSNFVNAAHVRAQRRVDRQFFSPMRDLQK